MPSPNWQFFDSLILLQYIITITQEQAAYKIIIIITFFVICIFNQRRS
jgi:hypothetical protein